MKELKVYITTLKTKCLHIGAQSCVIVGVLGLESLSSISWFIVIEVWYTILQLTLPIYLR